MMESMSRRSKMINQAVALTRLYPIRYFFTPSIDVLFFSGVLTAVNVDLVWLVAFLVLVMATSDWGRRMFKKDMEMKRFGDWRGKEAEQSDTVGKEAQLNLYNYNNWPTFWESYHSKLAHPSASKYTTYPTTKPSNQHSPDELLNLCLDHGCTQDMLFLHLTWVDPWTLPDGAPLSNCCMYTIGSDRIGSCHDLESWINNFFGTRSVVG